MIYMLKRVPTTKEDRAAKRAEDATALAMSIRQMSDDKPLSPGQNGQRDPALDALATLAEILASKSVDDARCCDGGPRALRLV